MSPLDQEMDEVERYRMPLIEHLLELRRRLLISVVALVLGMVASFVFIEDIYGWLTDPFVKALAESGVEGGLSIVHSPFEGVSTYLRTALVGGAVMASPAIALQAWLFIAPGLYQTERRVVVPLSLASTALFLVGALFCYYAIFPYAFPFFLKVIDVEAQLSVDGYLSAVVRMMLSFGLCFQLPVVVFFLARMGLIDHRDLVGGFRYAVVAIFVVAAVITPPDVMTQVLLALPLIVLYIVGIGVAWLFTTKRR